MKLSNKGCYAPPPRLKPAAQLVAATITAWPSVHARTHWLLGDEREIDGADFYRGQDEIGHIHLDSEAHIFVGQFVADRLIRLGLGSRFRWSPDAVMFRIRSFTHVGQALWLFELSYDRRNGVDSAELSRRIADYDGVTRARVRMRPTWRVDQREERR